MRIDRVGVLALILLALGAVAHAGQEQSANAQDDPNARFDTLLSGREVEMGRTVDAGQRVAVLARIAALETLNAIGDSAADLVYTPLAPCRIVDTRVPTAGILTVGAPRAFVVAGDSAVFAAQGGQAGGCGVPLGASAAMLNLVATGSTGPGNLRAKAWAAGTPVMPNASIINFGVVSGLPALANGLAVPICDPAATTCTSDLYVQTFASDTHFVADVVGFFSSAEGVLTGAQAPLEVSGSSVRLSTTGCAAEYVWKYNGSTWACMAEASMTYSSGPGISVSGSTIGLSNSGCAAGYVWKWNGSAWACTADANTTYSAGSGISVSGTTVGLSSSGCAAGYVWKWNGSAWACSPDIDTNTTYSAGTGFSLSGTTFSVNPAALYQSPVLSSENSSYGVEVSPTDWVTVHSASITAPPAVGGHVLALATGDARCGNCVDVSLKHILTETSDGTAGIATTDYLRSGLDPTVHPMLQGVFPIAAGATKTIYWRAIVPAYGTLGQPHVTYPTITLMFMPD